MPGPSAAVRVTLLLWPGAAALADARFGMCDEPALPAALAPAAVTAEPVTDAEPVHGAVMLALQHFLEKRPPRWPDGPSFMVRHVALSPGRGPRVCGEAPVGSWGGLGTFPDAEHACDDACLADPRCGYAVFQVETGECTGFADCRVAAAVETASGTFLVNERSAYACATSPAWCGACKHAGMSAAAAESCRVLRGEWYCAGLATCVAAGETEGRSGSCPGGELVCAGRGPRAGRLGSGLEQAEAVVAALDVHGAHPDCPRFAPGYAPDGRAGRPGSFAELSQQNASTRVATAQRVCTAEDKAAMSSKWLQDGSRLEQMCSVYSPPPEYKATGDMPPPAMWRPEHGTPDCCDAGQSCEVAGFRILENYLTLYSLCVPTANWTAPP